MHGSAPPLVGKNVANPVASFLTVGLMLAHLGWPEEEKRIEKLCARALATGFCTPDVGGSHSTSSVADWILEQLKKD